MLEIFSNWLGQWETLCSAELGAHLRQLPLTTFVREKFNTVQVDHPITDFASNSDRLIGAWVFEFDFDMTSHRQVGSGKQTNTAFAEPDAAPVDHGFVRGMIDHNPNFCVKRMTFPAAPIYFLQHSYRE
jgi:hypothetical protein